MHKIGIETAPPVAHGLAAEIGKQRRAWPDRPDKVLSVRVFDEGVDGLAGRIGRVICFGDMQVGDQDGVHARRLEIGDHALKIGKGRLVDGEGPVTILIVDVEIEDVGRYLVSL